MIIDAEFLLARLPAFYRQRDAESGGQLRALLDVIASQGQLVEQDIARLYDNWFIETCDDWLIPYIGDLLGVRGLYAVAGTASFSQRALVANTLRLRRRKGTLAVLEQLALDASGWRARGHEFFEQLATTQHLNHPRPHSLRTPDLRQGGALERVDSAFDHSCRSGEMRGMAAGGRYNIANIGLFVWRLQAYALQRSPALKAEGEEGRYHFDPLGRSLDDLGLGAGAMLYNRPRTETDVATLAEPVHLPEPLSRRRLHDELTALRQAIADGSSPRLGYFGASEGGPVLRLWLDGAEVASENLVICNLSPLPGVVPADWRRPPASLAVARSDGSGVLNFPRQAGDWLVGIDPVLGRIALPAGAAVGQVDVAYAYGFVGDVGGGPYDRRPLQAADEPRDGLLDPADFEQLLTVPGDHPTLAAAIGAMVPGNRVLIRLTGDSREQLTPDLNLPDTHLAIEAVNQRRPVVVGDWKLRGNSNTRLTLSGLLVDGQLQLQGSLRQVEVRHCSLVPARGGIRHSGNGSLLELALSYSLCGPIRANLALAGVSLRHSAVDGGDGAALELPDTHLTVDRCTLVGATKTGELSASNSLFTGAVTVSRRQQGCVRFCFLSPKSQTPRRYRCQPDLAVAGLPPTLAKTELVRVSPSFTATSFGHPAYLQLRQSTPPEIRQGAEDGAEMGVWNLLQQPQRAANLRQAVDEYLRFGLEAEVIFVN